MISRKVGTAHHPNQGADRAWLVLILAIAFFHDSTALSDDAPVVADQKSHKLFPKHKAKSQGTLGYGPPGVYPGVQGFGLGYHLGYGYGGDALGVGAEGGYPLYGGPGYPHAAPCLRRLGPIAPFHYYGGIGGPWPVEPNFFEGVGPLVADEPVVTFESDPSESGSPADYGCFTGSLPYPETTFAPFATSLGEKTSERTAPIPPAPYSSAVPQPPDASRSLGLDLEPVVDAGRARALKVIRLQPGGVAEAAGLQPGDVIRSANGYLTEQPGNLTWILRNAAPDKILNLNVLTAKDGEVHTITVTKP